LKIKIKNILDIWKNCSKDYVPEFLKNLFWKIFGSTNLEVTIKKRKKKCSFLKLWSCNQKAHVAAAKSQNLHQWFLLEVQFLLIFFIFYFIPATIHSTQQNCQHLLIGLVEELVVAHTLHKLLLQLMFPRHGFFEKISVGKPTIEGNSFLLSKYSLIIWVRKWQILWILLFVPHIKIVESKIKSWPI